VYYRRLEKVRDHWFSGGGLLYGTGRVPHAHGYSRDAATRLPKRFSPAAFSRGLRGDTGLEVSSAATTDAAGEVADQPMRMISVESPGISSPAVFRGGYVTNYNGNYGTLPD